MFAGPYHRRPQWAPAHVFRVSLLDRSTSLWLICCYKIGVMIIVLPEPNNRVCALRHRVNVFWDCACTMNYGARRPQPRPTRYAWPQPSSNNAVTCTRSSHVKITRYAVHTQSNIRGPSTSKLTRCAVSHVACRRGTRSATRYAAKDLSEMAGWLADLYHLT